MVCAVGVPGPFARLSVVGDLFRQTTVVYSSRIRHLFVGPRSWAMGKERDLRQRKSGCATNETRRPLPCSRAQGNRRAVQRNFIFGSILSVGLLLGLPVVWAQYPLQYPSSSQITQGWHRDFDRGLRESSAIQRDGGSRRIRLRSTIRHACARERFALGAGECSAGFHAIFRRGHERQSLYAGQSH